MVIVLKAELKNKKIPSHKKGIFMFFLIDIDSNASC